MAQRVLLGAIVALFCVRNLPWHLDNFDQAKQAYVSFEMVTQGHWWFQHTPMQNVATKPLLAGWISAALFYVTHWWDGAWRLPSLASALAILLILKRAGDRVLPEWGGALAASVFGLNFMAPRLATLVRTDMLLTLFIFLAGWIVYEKIRTGAEWTARERWTIFLLTLGSMLTKGPIAYAFLLPGLVAFLLICKRRREPVHAWSGWWSWFAPLLLFFVWVMIGIRNDAEFYNQVVLKEFAGRFTVGEQAVHKNQPFYFYLTHLLRDFAPWSLGLIALLFVKDARRVLVGNRASLWLVCWSLGGLLVMSLVPSKRPDRIFPVVPPLCLLIVYGVRGLQTSGWALKRVCFISTGVALFLSVGYAVLNIVQNYRGNEEALVKFGARVRGYAEQNGLRYAVTNGKDEGMLLYLCQPAFLKSRDAKTAWEERKLDALVLSERDLAGADVPAQPWFLEDASGVGAGKGSQYFFHRAKSTAMSFPDDLDALWAPWRVEYFSMDKSRDFLTEAAQTSDDAAHLVVARRKNAFLMLNRFPYAVGHMMAVPYRKVADLTELSEREQLELWELAALAQKILRQVANAQGFNIGLNIGKCAGAGFADHLHLHIVPRWNDDHNFMPVLAGARVLPEALPAMYEKLAAAAVSV